MRVKQLLNTVVVLILANWPEHLSAKPLFNEQVKGSTQIAASIPAITKAWQSADLYSRGTGIVDKVHVEVGQIVSKGDVLVAIEDTTLAADLSILKAELKEAQAELKLFQLDLTRINKLLHNNLVSVSDRDRLKAKVVKSEAIIEGINGRISRKKIQQNFLTIRAPFDGFVISRNVERGDLVMSDVKTDTPLLKVADLSKLRIQYRVPQGTSHLFTKGQGVYFTGAIYGKKVNAKVDLISPSIDESFGTVLMESWISNEHLELPIGLRGEVKVEHF